MQIEVFPQQQMSLLVLSDSPAGAKLAYRLSKAGVNTAFVGPLPMTAKKGRGFSCQRQKGCQFWPLFNQGRWQWVHVSLANQPGPGRGFEPIADLIHKSRRLGLYISLTLRLPEVAGSPLLQPLSLDQGLRSLLPVATWITLLEVGATVYSQAQVSVVEEQLRQGGFRGVGVVVIRDGSTPVGLASESAEDWVSEQQWLKKMLAMTP